MISVKRIRISELLSFVSNPAYPNLEHIPISRHRAKSYVDNPRSSPNDVVLYLGYINSDLVGYRTIMPDTLITNNKELKVGWLSGNWVNPKFRRKGIASTLFSTALSDWDNNLLYTNYAPESKAVYDKTNRFTLAAQLRGTRIYIRPCLSQLLPSKAKILKLLKPVWCIADLVLSLVNPLPLLAKLYCLKGVTFEYLNKPDDDVNSLFEQITQNSISGRKAQELDWILNQPWLVSAPLGDAMGDKYFFSSAPKRFERLLFKIYKDKILLGFVMANISNGVLSTPYISCPKGSEKLFAKVLLKHAAEMGVDWLTVYHELIAKELKGLLPFGLLSRNQLRNYYVTNELKEQLTADPSFIEGDGDCAFV